MQMPSAAVRTLWLLGLALMWPRAESGNSEQHLRQLLATETSLIDALRDFVEALDQQLELIRSETAAIERIHHQVGQRVEEHMGNPLNVLTILKRFHSVWPWLEQQANATQNLAEKQPDFELELRLPSEEDYETALFNLLRLQSVYDLEPATLSLGIVQGLKLGSAMSWGDCLEMARKSDRNGDYAVAKYWLETALGKLPAGRNATISVGEQERGKVQILEASLNMDYRAGEFLSALATAKELLLLRPSSQNVQKAKAKIERALNESQAKFQPSNKHKPKHAKSVEQLIVDELCRATSTEQSVTGTRFTECRQDVSNLRMLRVEQLSEDPLVVLYHDVLSSQQTEQLIGMLDEEEEEEPQQAKRVAFEPLKFTRLAQKRLRGIQRQLGMETELWQARRHGHEHVTPPDAAEEGRGRGQGQRHRHVARALLNLQEARLGGAVAFPQLELSVRVPRGGLLYWRTRSGNELPAATSSDYRSRQVVCPVLLGVQLSAWTELS